MENTTLKFEGQFKVGETIKAYHFHPSMDRAESYLVGEILSTGTSEEMGGAKVFNLKMTANVIHGIPTEMVGDETATVPMEIGFMEFDSRIEKVLFHSI